MERIASEVERLVCSNSSGRPRYRVLFVDDEENVREAFRALFRHPSLAGLSVDFADSVNQAMAMIAMNTYDLLILDHRLGDGTAETLVHTFRDYGYDVPFLCVSGYDDAEAAMLKLGASGFLSKLEATNPNKLAKAVESTLGSYWKRACR